MKSILSYFHPLEQIKRKRGRFMSAGHLPEAFVHNIEQPAPELDDLASDMNFIVLDFETTGLDYEEDLILSMGWVEVSNNKVDLATCHHLYIDSDSQIKPETAVINHITPQMLEQGVSIHDAMMTFFEAAAGKVIVAHGCIVETSFLNHYLAKRYHLVEFPLLWLDTLCIEKKLAQAIQHDADIDLTLASVRARYNLPEYNSHNALADAVSTAELFLAINKRIEPDGSARFGPLYKMSQ